MLFHFASRHVVLPIELVKLVPKTHLMSEAEWRGIGVQQSQGWIHYMTHKPGEKIQYCLHEKRNIIFAI
jgi:hypothetical protein